MIGFVRLSVEVSLSYLPILATLELIPESSLWTHKELIIIQTYKS